MDIVSSFILRQGFIGFKYFGFGGLDKNTKGVKAFEGIRKGDGAAINLNLTPGGHGAFKIRIMIDGPYANSTWNGKEIGVISVPADAPRKAATYTVAVPDVEGLKGKHAIYLVAEGPDVEQQQNNQRQYGNRSQLPQRPTGLFDLHGIGFSKQGEKCEPPTVPAININVDGKKLSIPATPIRCTNANGLTDAIRYQVYAPLNSSSEITVHPSHPSVKYKVSSITEGRATVKCTYNGQTKIYLIN